MKNSSTMPTKPKYLIRPVGHLWQVINQLGHTIYQTHDRKEAIDYAAHCGRFPLTDQGVGLETVYQDKAYRDKRYFVRF